MTLSASMMEQFQLHVLELVSSRAEGFTEYDLLKALAERELLEYGGTRSRDSLALYRIHFLLFHVLYTLRDKLRAENSGDLEISPLCIRRIPYAARPSGALDVADPLRAYYLDWNHFSETTGPDVDRMLGRFWIRHIRNDRRAEALSVLGLADPVDDETIKQAYRRLAMQHHPDRGGDGIQLREINAAVEVLLP